MNIEQTNVTSTYCSSNFLITGCSLNWALPFENHTPPMEDFGIPTKISILSHSRSRQNLTVYIMLKSYERLWNPTKSNSCTNNCNKFNSNGTWHSNLPSYSAGIKHGAGYIFLLELSVCSTGNVTLLPFFHRGVWSSNGIAQFVTSNQHSQIQFVIFIFVSKLGQKRG